ncbi:hypothetical protein EVAR_37063_1 [Eumeta japonica]|uniref:Uncharacterized protein n=1 Tax=Eumeta variegata TaxID=151549 RepID=A0A4C1WF46_EUMVA|nr:hypothetical protein EVAR_37063_1 [Eumeta japonica]
MSSAPRQSGTFARDVLRPRLVESAVLYTDARKDKTLGVSTFAVRPLVDSVDGVRAAYLLSSNDSSISNVFIGLKVQPVTLQIYCQIDEK